MFHWSRRLTLSNCRHNITVEWKNKNHYRLGNSGISRVQYSGVLYSIVNKMLIKLHSDYANQV